MAAQERLLRAGPAQALWRAPHAPLAPPRAPAPRRRAPAAAAALPPPVSLRVMASPFDAFEAADRQFAEMQSQMDRDMDAAFREMDRSIDRSLREVQQIQRQVDEEAARLAREAAQQPGVRFERAEQRSYNSYSYYESIEIRSVPMTALVPSMAPAPSPGIAGPLLIAALALGATWAGITALFARNYNLTTFSEASRGKLLLGWPYLAAASDKFRAQLGSALRGQQYKAPTDEARGGGAGGGGGGGGS